MWKMLMNSTDSQPSRARGVGQPYSSAQSHRGRPTPTLGAKLVSCTVHVQASSPNVPVPAPSRHKLCICNFRDCPRHQRALWSFTSLLTSSVVSRRVRNPVMKSSSVFPVA